MPQEAHDKETRLQANYARLTDDQLIKIATGESHHLHELGLKILREELAKECAKNNFHELRRYFALDQGRKTAFGGSNKDFS